jgi:hypothetical protein
VIVFFLFSISPVSPVLLPQWPVFMKSLVTCASCCRTSLSRFCALLFNSDPRELAMSHCITTTEVRIYSKPY